MNFNRLATLILFFCAAAFISCVAYRYIAPIQTFSHEIHEKPVVREKMDCFTCHNVTIDEADVAKRVEMLKQTLKDTPDKRFIRGVCHKCHIDEDTKVIDAPFKCLVCHQGSDKVVPDSHNGDWKRTHATSIKDAGIDGIYYDGVYKDGKKARFACSTCHEESFCVNCHIVRDFPRAKMHPRTFRIAHVAAAAADPASCGTCHSVAFCSDCHKSGKRRR